MPADAPADVDHNGPGPCTGMARQTGAAHRTNSGCCLISASHFATYAPASSSLLARGGPRHREDTALNPYETSVIARVARLSRAANLRPRLVHLGAPYITATLRLAGEALAERIPLTAAFRSDRQRREVVHVRLLVLVKHLT